VHTSSTRRATACRHPAPDELATATSRNRRHRVGRRYTGGHPPPSQISKIPARAASATTVADQGARFHHQADRPAERDMGADAALIDQDEGPIQHIQPHLLHESERDPIADWDRPGRRQPRHGPSTSHGARRINIRPQPWARDRPNPRARATRKVAGSRTVSTPEMSRRPKTAGLPSVRGT